MRTGRRSWRGNTTDKSYFTHTRVLKIFAFCLVLTLSTFVRESFSYTCENQSDCGDFMICMNNQCFCDEDDATEALLNDKRPDLSLCKKFAALGDKCDNSTSVCTGGSICANSGYCTCPLGFFHTKGHDADECKKPFGSPCHEESECNTHAFITCGGDKDSENRTCTCIYDYQMAYDPLKKSCVGRIGHQCEFHEWMGMQLTCGENSWCSPAVDPNDNYYGICKCNASYVVDDTKEYRCESLYNRHCNEILDCDNKVTKLECLNNKCQCKSGSIFDNTSNPEQCRLLVGETCDISEKACVQNAQCIISLKTDFKLACQCNDHYMATSEGKCQLGPDARGCDEDIPNKMCHKESGLKCIDTFCQCPEEQIFNPLTFKCEGLHGSPCDFLNPKCVENSHCSQTDNICKCNDLFKVTENGFCQHGYKSPCNFQDDTFCPKSLGLACQGSGTCTCREESGKIFDQKANKCLLAFGENCNRHQFKNPCVSNAFCNTSDTIFDTCQCDNRSTPTSDGYCLLDYGQPCDASEFYQKATCNRESGLSCFNERCNCSTEGEEYNSTSTRCERNISLPTGVDNITLENVPKTSTTSQNRQLNYSEIINSTVMPSSCKNSIGFTKSLNVFAVVGLMTVLIIMYIM